MRIIEYITSCIEQEDMTPVKQELIRCKDCRHYWQEYGLCAKLTDDCVCRVHVHQDDFCSFAERKEE